MMKRYQIIDGKMSENGSSDSPVELYINPSESERQFLIGQLQLDEHTLNSALDPEEVSRIEFETNHTAVIIKRPKRYTSSDKFLFKVSSLGLFLFPERLVVVMLDDDVIFDGRTFLKVRSLKDLFLKVLFRCIQHFEEHLNVIQKVSNELEAEINTALTNKDLIYMFNLEKSLVYYLRAINANSKVIEKIKINLAKIGLTAEDSEFLEDLTIESSQCYEEANTISQVLSGMMDAWVSLVSNNLNIRMKTLTILSLCIMLPTLIVSIFSMNVVLPLPEGSLLSFWFVTLLAAVSILVIVLLWRHHKW